MIYKKRCIKTGSKVIKKVLSNYRHSKPCFSVLLKYLTSNGTQSAHFSKKVAKWQDIFLEAPLVSPVLLKKITVALLDYWFGAIWTFFPRKS